MKQSSVSAAIVEPYAEALMAVARDNNLTEQIGNDMSGLLELLNTSTEFRELLTNPFISADAKKGVINQVASDCQDYVKRFLMLLVDRRRIFLLEGIAQHYLTLLRKLNNTVLAEVKSTVELSDSQRETVIQKVKDMTGAAQVELQTQLDPELIGGVVIKIGSQVLDASIRGQLRRISTALLNTAS